MGIKERKDKDKQALKKRIMTAAIEIIEQEGYEKLSIRKIAAKIEYSPTTIYLYYKDKAEILSDMTNYLYSKVVDDTTRFLDTCGTQPANMKVHSILLLLIKVLCSEPEMAKALMSSSVNYIFSNDDTGNIPTNPGMIQLDLLISEGIEENSLRPDIQNSAWMLISASFGFVMSAIASQLHQRHDFDQLAENFVTILMQGIQQ